MIGWKAKYGHLYISGSVVSYEVDKITWTDEGPWVLGTIFSDNTDLNIFTNPRYYVSTGGYESFKNIDLLNAQNYCNQAFINDYDSIYVVPSLYNRGGAPYIAKQQQLIPSSYLACPNLMEYYRDYPTTLPAPPSVVYIPALDKYVVYQAAAGGVFNNVDGVLVQAGAGGIWNGQSLNFSAFFSILGYDGTPESLLKSENYRFLTVSLSDSPYSLQFAKTTENPSGVFRQVKDAIGYLIEKWSPPDVSFPVNPYEPGGDSGEGGGGGTFDNDSDLITDSTLPTISSSNTGFTRIYNPTLSQVQELANYLWTDESVIQTIWNKIKQFFENPMDAIIGFNLVPVPVPNGGIEEFKLMFIPTGVNMIVAANQFVDVDCGTLDIKEYYGSALDYSPYTKISIFLPFIGMTNVDVDEVMGRTLQIKYRVDIVTGSCVAKIFVAGNCIYQFTGHCAINIPFSSADFTNYVSAVIGIAKLAVGAYTAGVGASLAAEAASAAQQTSQQVTTTEITNTARNPSTGRQITTGTSRVVETVEAPVKASSTKASYSGLTPGNVSNTVGQIMSSKPHIEHAGGFSGNSGYLGVRRPFALIKRPRMCMPANYQTLNGFPSMITMTLSECSGYTLINQVQLTGMTATNPEQAEILELLKSGVIF